MNNTPEKMDAALADDELENVSGGGCGKKDNRPKAKFEVGDLVCYARSPAVGPYPIDKRIYENGEWKYSVNTNGQSLYWIGENLLVRYEG